MSYGTADLSEIQKTYDAIGKGTRRWAIKDEVKLLKLKAGENALRILPPMKDKKHFGEKLFIHNRIGLGEDQIVCKRLTPWIKGKCLVCEEQEKLKKSGATDEEVKQLSASMKWVYNLINLDRPEDGVQVWVAPYTVGDEILRLCYNRETRATDKDISHPEKGYNIFLTKEGEGLSTRYKGFDRDDQASPIQRTEWLDQLFDLRAIVNVPEDAEIAEALYGLNPTPIANTRPQRTDSEPFVEEAVEPLQDYRQAEDSSPALDDLKTRIKSRYNK